jgi:hypothetical protein
MTTIASDTFTGTNGTALSSHTADTGGSWNQRTGSFEIQSNKITCAGAALATLDAITPGTPDYDVSADLVITDDSAAGVTGRHHATDNQFYYFRYLTDGMSGSNGTWQLYLFDGGATLLNDFAETQTRGTTRRITLRLRGTAISGLVDGVEKVSATNSTITADGVAGMRNGGSPGSATLDNFEVVVPSLLTAVGANLDCRWHDRSAVSRSVDCRWDDRSAIGRTVDCRWDDRAAISRNLDARWDDRSAINRPLECRWDDRSAASRTLDCRWDDRSAVGQTLDSRWDDRKTVAGVRLLPWHIRGLAASPIELDWQVRSAVGKTTDLRWDVVTDGVWAVGSSLTLRWHLLVAVRTLGVVSATPVRGAVSRTPALSATSGS